MIECYAGLKMVNFWKLLTLYFFRLDAHPALLPKQQHQSTAWCIYFTAVNMLQTYRE